MTADSSPSQEPADHHSDAADPAPPSFAAIDSHDALVDWSAAYCERAVEAHDLAVDLSLVDWAVSTRAKRRAAAVKRPRIPGASVGTPLDWDGVEAGVERCTVVLTWAAFRAFDREAWTGVLRHELVHVEGFQRFGTTGHGPAFRRRARAVDASLDCPRFAVPNYRLRCGRCGSVVARRYRDCKLVRNRDSYRSTCCRAELDCEEPDGA